MSFSGPGPSIGPLTALHCHISLIYFNQGHCSICPSWLGHFWRVLLVNYFVECPSTWVCLMFPQDYFQIIHFWQEYHKLMLLPFSLHHFREYMISTSPFPGDVNFDPLVKVVSASFLHHSVTIFPLYWTSS